LDTREFNSKGMVIIGLAVVATVILLAVVPKDGPLGGVRSASTDEASGTTLAPSTTLVPVATLPGTVTTKAPTATTTPATATTKKGTTATTTTTINPATRPVLQLGSTAPDVLTLQQKLIALKFLTGTADGNFGPATKAAVIAFQTSKSLTPADGIVGAATWAALG
jgi:peptidoglycan hydrolase-like protein with peptidoglycan-binding domain